MRTPRSSTPETTSDPGVAAKAAKEAAKAAKEAAKAAKEALKRRSIAANAILKTTTAKLKGLYEAGVVPENAYNTLVVAEKTVGIANAAAKAAAGATI